MKLLRQRANIGYILTRVNSTSRISEKLSQTFCPIAVQLEDLAEWFTDSICSEETKLKLKSNLRPNCVLETENMAEAMASNEEILMCPICLDLLNTLATIPCGHSYCMDCITECWNQLDQKGVYSCPKCRETFCPRPALKKTTIVAELVEKVSKATIKDDPAGIEDVECDVCIGKKSKAVRSCLDCLLSYCKTHLKAHNDHGKVCEIFCRIDQSLICYLCTMDEHRGHDTVTAVAEWTEKQVK